MNNNPLPAAKITLQIERPAYIDSLLKDFRYMYEIDLREVPSDILQKSRHLATATGGPTGLGSFIKATRLLEGTLVIVDQNLSRDLEISNVFGDLKDIIWPADCIEMRFQDPTLPSIMMISQRMHSNQDGVAFLVDAKDGASLTLSMPESEWREYILGQKQDVMMGHTTPYDMGLDKKESDAIRYMATLALKVLAYSSIPQHKPEPVVTKDQRKAAGIHPKHFNPRLQKKILVVKYLPRIIKEREDKLFNPTGKTHQFLGRIGVLRFYKDDRYTHMKNKWQWLPPIQPPEGVKVIVKVRKV
jgi:hypothetical protein